MSVAGAWGLVLMVIRRYGNVMILDMHRHLWGFRLEESLVQQWIPTSD